MEPIYSTSFDIEFTSVDISEEDRKILSECVVAVSNKKVIFGVFTDESDKIIPIDSVLKLKSGKKSDVLISILDKNGKIVGNLIYKECNMEVDFDDFLSFSHGSKNPFGMDFPIKKELTLNLFPSAILYNNQEIA